MKTNQEIVPVILQGDNKKSYNQTPQTERNQQKLIRSIKNTNSELFIYEEIVLRVLLTELHTNETHRFYPSTEYYHCLWQD